MNWLQFLLTENCALFPASILSFMILYSVCVRAKIRITGRLIIPSISLSYIRSHALFAILWFLCAAPPSENTPMIHIGKKARHIAVKSGSIKRPETNKVINTSTWGSTTRIKLSATAHTASADLSTIFCFSPAWIFLWYSIGRHCILYMIFMRKSHQSFIAFWRSLML